jgi:hypothetical protein
VFDDRKNYPDIAAQPIKFPIFMSGLPRTGTSYLNALMACDPKHLAPLHWQMWCPSPPPNDPDIDDREQIERGKYLMEIQDFQSADIRDKHSYGASSMSPAWSSRTARCFKLRRFIVSSAKRSPLRLVRQWNSTFVTTARANSANTSIA